MYWSTQEDTDDPFNVPCRQLVDRQLIQEMKFLCEICKKDRRVRDALEMLGASVAALFPLDLLEKAASVRVQRFLVSDWL